MGYADADQIHRRNVAEAFSADATGAQTTFGRAGTMGVTGNFTATIILEQQMEGNDATPGEWIEAGQATEPGTYRFRTFKPTPWRVRVSDHQNGTVTVFVEMSDDLQVVT